MSPKGSKRKISCKFCQQKAEYMNLYNDYFCSKCFRFQQEVKVSEVKLLPIFKLKKYVFTAQKYAYFISNAIESRIGSCERRDLTKFLGKKDFNIRYYFFNDVNRVIASLDGKTTNMLKDTDANWKVYDYGRNLLGEIRFTHESDTWEIVNSDGSVIAIRDLQDSKVALKTARQFTMVDINDSEKQLFRVVRQNGFRLEILSEDTIPQIAWATVICIHRMYYL